MQKFKTLPTLRLTMLMLGSMLALCLIWSTVATAQEPETNLSSQLVELQDRVARLEAALMQNSNGTPADTPEQRDPAATPSDTASSAAGGQDMGGDKDMDMTGQGWGVKNSKNFGIDMQIRIGHFIPLNWDT